jgi:hypothetical protein
MTELLLDAAGRRRSPATCPDFTRGVRRATRAFVTPPIHRPWRRSSAVMRAAGDNVHGRRLRGLSVVLWRAMLRIHEVLALGEADLDHRRGAARPPRQGRPPPRGRHERVGLGAAAAVDRRPARAPGGFAALRHQWSHTRTTVVQRGCPRGLAPDGRGGRRAAALRAAPASPRARQSRWPTKASL